MIHLIDENIPFSMLDWHEINADESNYIDEKKYREIQVALAICAERLLRSANDDLQNHKFYTYIMQGPEFKYSGPRFIRWLKKKLYDDKPIELLFIVLDDKSIDIRMDVFTFVPEKYWSDIAVPQLQSLIKRLKESA